MPHFAQTILVTGGAGYIGSHTCVELISAGHNVVVLDNLSNSKAQAVQRIGQIAGHAPVFVRGDLRDANTLDRIFQSYHIDAVIHFAGLKAVGESVAQPLKYYENNVQGTLELLGSMQRADCKRLVFSSSATVYGASEIVPITEQFAIQPTNPYGSTKAMIERILLDLAVSDSTWKIALLRYFNPVGAHISGLIGEDPVGIPNNLFPYVSQVAGGRLKQLQVHGSDYATRDGTGERDYVHVVDLARGHLAALSAIEKFTGAVPINLGTGRGSTVLEVVAAFQLAAGVEVAYALGPRRPGDVGACYADVSKAREVLGWSAEYGLERMCVDSWRWQKTNPLGYEDV
jgi:UDP-glucose 4-epimerase